MTCGDERQAYICHLEAKLAKAQAENERLREAPIRVVVEKLIADAVSCEHFNDCPDCGQCWDCAKDLDDIYPYLLAFMGDE